MIQLNDSGRYAERDRLVTQFRYLCKRGARKFHRAGLDRSDLEQVAAIGLIKACDRYDPDLRTPFEAFAWLFVVGELMHYVRDHERLVRAPRRLRDLDRRFQTAHDALVLEFGREPSLEDLGERLGIAGEELKEVYRYREQAVTQSIDVLGSSDLISHSYTIEDREDRMLVDEALRCLTQTERLIILGLYHSGYSQVEIADRLGYSRRHISRLHRSALNKMRPLSVFKTR